MPTSSALATGTPVGASDNRYRLESYDHNGKFVCALPYRNIQSESMLGAQGHSLRCDIPFRNYSQVTQANLYPGIHELWLYDRLFSDTEAVFAGPLWDATASSSTGVVSVSAQCPLSYLAKRQLKSLKVYVTQRPSDIISDLITYINSVRSTNLLASIDNNSANTVTVTYQPRDRNAIADLIASVSSMVDGVDYYFRSQLSISNVGQHFLHIVGGLIKPTSPSQFALDYGGKLNGYSLQYNAQGIANSWDEIAADNGTIQNAADATAQANYDNLYEGAESSDLTTPTSLTTAAITKLKAVKNTLAIPSIVTRDYSPILDFDFGSQFNVAIDDEYTQYDALVRVVGWQITPGQGDTQTTVIYTTDVNAVT